jgi:hypothetical protein
VFHHAPRGYSPWLESSGGQPRQPTLAGSARVIAGLAMR